MSPFLFVLVMEGLTGLIKKEVDLNEFIGFSVNEEIVFDILQIGDDTLILGESSWSNLWSVKVILRGFGVGLGPLSQLLQKQYLWN